MKKFLIAVIILFFIFITTIFFAPNFINLNKYKEKISEYVSKSINKDVKINGNIEIKFLPVPEVFINNMEIGDYISSELVKVKFKIIPMLKGDYKVNVVDLDKSVINFDLNANNRNSWDNLKDVIAEVKNIGTSSIIMRDSKIKIMAGDIASYVNKVNLQINNVKNDKFLITGNITKHNNYYSIMSEINNNDFSLTFDSEVIKVLLNGNLNSGDNLLSGKINSEIKDHKIITTIINNFFPLFPIMENAKLSEIISCSGDFYFNKEGYFVENFTFNSDKIKGTTDASFVNGKNTSNISIKLDKLDVDQMFISNNDSQKDTNNDIDSLSDDIFNNLNISSNDFINFDNSEINADIKLNISDLNLKGGNIQNFSINIKNEDNYVAIKELNLVFSENNLLKLSDTKNVTIDNQNVILGKLAIQGDKLSDFLKWFKVEDNILLQDSLNKLNYQSRVILAPSEVTLLNIDSSLGDGKIEGRVTIKNSINNERLFDIDLDVNNLDLSLVKTANLYDSINKMLNSSNEKSYLAEYKWLREISGTSKLNIRVKNSNFKDININSIAGKVTLSPSIINFEEVSIDTDITKLDKLDFEIDARLLKPKVHLDVAGDKVNIDVLSDIFYGNYKNDQENNKESVNYDFDSPINLFRFDKFDGKMKIGLKELLYDSEKLENLNFSGSMRSDALFIETLKANSLGGEVEVRGSIVRNGNINKFSLSFALLEAKLGKLANFTSMNGFSDNSILSIRGSVITSGDTLQELLFNSTFNSNFIANNIDVNNMNLKEVIDIASGEKSVDKDKILDSVDYALNNGTTKFNDINGEIIIKDRVISTKDVKFNSYYSSGIIALSYDLNSSLLNSLVQISFRPEANSAPVVFAFNLLGNIKDYHKVINKENLFSYLKKKYSIENTEENPVNVKKDDDYIYQKVQ